MPATTASAPAKVILFGEHSVVYGYPAIAAPVKKIKAKANVKADPKGEPGQIRIVAPAVALDEMLSDLDSSQPLATAIRKVCSHLKVKQLPACTVRVTSTIPLAAGLGSGAAVSVAIIRAISSFLGHPLPNEDVCQLAFEVEKLYHSMPSGIDNTVITYEKPVYYIKSQPIEILTVKKPFTLVIADTGITTPTKESVNDVRKAWQANKKQFDAYFESTGSLAVSARQAIEAGNNELLGPLMDANHGLLRKIGVSCAKLDQLVLAARQAGAHGAKLSGGGRGGNLIALVNEEHANSIAKALKNAGAVNTIVTKISK